MSDDQSPESTVSQNFQQELVNWRYGTVFQRSAAMAAKFLIEIGLFCGLSSFLIAYFGIRLLGFPLYELLNPVPGIQNSFPVMWIGLWGYMAEKMWCYTTDVRPQ